MLFCELTPPDSFQPDPPYLVIPLTPTCVAFACLSREDFKSMASAIARLQISSHMPAGLPPNGSAKAGSSRGPQMDKQAILALTKQLQAQALARSERSSSFWYGWLVQDEDFFCPPSVCARDAHAPTGQQRGSSLNATGVKGR